MYVAVLSSGYLFHPSHGIVHGAPSLIIWKGQGSKKLQTNEQKVESSLSMTCTRHSERKRAIWCGGWHLPQNADLLAFAGTWPYGGSHPLPNAWSFPSAFFFFPGLPLRVNRLPRISWHWRKVEDMKQTNKTTLQKHGVGGNKDEHTNKLSFPHSTQKVRAEDSNHEIGRD